MKRYHCKLRKRDETEKLFAKYLKNKIRLKFSKFIILVTSF